MGQTVEMTFESVAERTPGDRWQHHFQRVWPDYRRWYLAQGPHARPTYLECERALRAHLPKLMPLWEHLTDLAGGGDLESRFLSLYCPPPYLTACSQCYWPGSEPMIVRNYDYSPRLCEKMIWRTEWNGQAVLGQSDCLIGLLDGINESGLAISLNFGGIERVGRGFGAPVVVRYLLEFCHNAAEAAQTLRHIPIHMAYNILMVDRGGDYVTGFTKPDGPTILHRTMASTNHQDHVAWPRHAEATATLERERRLFEMLARKNIDPEQFVSAFLEPPLYQSKFQKGYGTLYTAVYKPGLGEAEYWWPGIRQSFGLSTFQEKTIAVKIPPHKA